MVEPALTAEEWADKSAVRDDCLIEHYETFVAVEPDMGTHIHDSGCHALAALCLHGQPFGFTREDVEWLRLMALDMEDLNAPANVRAVTDLADRIEALLPPEGG